eukprot:gene15446-18324_t
MQQRAPVDEKIDRLMALNTELHSLVTQTATISQTGETVQPMAAMTPARIYALKAEILQALTELSNEIKSANLQALTPVLDQNMLGDADSQSSSTVLLPQDAFQKLLTPEVVQKTITQWDTVSKEREKLLKNIGRVQLKPSSTV